MSLSARDRKAHASSGCNSPRFHPQDFSLDYKLGSGLWEVDMGGLSPGAKGQLSPCPDFHLFLEGFGGQLLFKHCPY